MARKTRLSKKHSLYKKYQTQSFLFLISFNLPLNIGDLKVE